VRDLLFLTSLRRGEDWALLGLRLAAGLFLVHGVWDNITSDERMEEFVRFLAHHGFFEPGLLARISVWAQFFCGLAFVLGALVRWAGLVCMFNFAVALAMVHWQQDLRGWWPALALLGIGALLATHGAGRLSMDRLFGAEAVTSG